MKKATYSLLALLLLGLLLGAGYWVKGYLGFGRTNADLLEAAPSEIALAFAQNLDQGPSWGFEDALAYTDTFADQTQPDYYSMSSQARDLLKDSMEIPRDCRLSTSSAQEIEVIDQGNVYQASLRYQCGGEEVTQSIYLRDSSWETLNSHLPLMVITPAAARASHPIG